MRYFSQFGEDRILERLFKGVTDGFFVDVGAHNGVTDSNTLMLEGLGWDGICIEPHSRYFRDLLLNRKVTCLNYVVWDKNLRQTEFHETAPGGWSRVGGGGNFPTQRITHPEARTLDSILKGVERVDFVSIDVEGHENYVLDGWTIGNHDPRVVLVEDLDHDGVYDDYFHEYTPIYAWKQGKRGSNVWYCREQNSCQASCHRG